MSGKYAGFRRFTTKRFIFSMIVFATGTAMTCFGKLSGDNWVMMSFGVIAGHQLPELGNIVAAWRGKRGDKDASNPG